MNPALVCCLSAMLLVAMPVIIYPLRHIKQNCVLMVAIVIALAVLAYWYCGNMPAWNHFLQQSKQQQQLEAIFKKFKNPQHLIAQLKQRVLANPNNARGWYLLGKLYASNHQWQLATQAFYRAYHLDANNEEVIINYAQGLWQVNKQQFDQKIRDLLYNLLKHNPKQHDALAMLAMDAFSRHDYRLARGYWMELLKMVPEQSEDAYILRQAIAQSYTAGRPTSPDNG